MQCETVSPKGSPSTKSISTPHMTMRQTVANPKQAISAGAQDPGIVSNSKEALPAVGQARGRGQDVATPVPPSSNSKPIPQSIRHQPIVDADWGLSMSEIVAQQQIEKDIIKEAVARRDLQEIQAEQEFQEWWNKESARVQAAGQEVPAAPTKAPRKNRGRGGGRGKEHKPAGQSGGKSGAASTGQATDK